MEILGPYAPMAPFGAASQAKPLKQNTCPVFCEKEKKNLLPYALAGRFGPVGKSPGLGHFSWTPLKKNQITEFPSFI